MNNLLLIIDLQRDFINENTQHLIKKIDDLVKSNCYETVAFTKFINLPDGIWERKLNYKGCLTEKEQELVINNRGYKVIDKYLYTAFNKNLEKFIKENNVDRIYLCGIDTECCVLKTCLDLFENDYDVFVLKDFCACTHGELENNQALEIIGRNIGFSRIV